MGGVARIAVQMGEQVSGSDQNTYPPMSTQLEALNVDLKQGYSKDNIPKDVDLVVVGNTISRGNPELEHVLSSGIKYTSGAQWLHDQVLFDKWVLAVSGTHGKTTTASLLTWLLEYNGLEPSYLVGGVPENFGESSRLSDSIFFVIEADEYDTCFSDKRSKFLHYCPRTLIVNNLEFDHADIFDSIADIQKQFHHLLKILPTNALVVSNQDADYFEQVIEQGFWSDQTKIGSQASADWSYQLLASEPNRFTLQYQGEEFQVDTPLLGEHNVQNAITAIAAAHHAGIPVQNCIDALASFKSIKRRLECIYDDNGIRIYDDFAHHPTAIKATIEALKAIVAGGRVIAILEPRSNTMKMGVHQDTLAQSLQSADQVKVFAGQSVLWNIDQLKSNTCKTYDSTKSLIDDVVGEAKPGDHILIMSNGGFENLHSRLVEAFKKIHI